MGNIPVEKQREMDYATIFNTFLYSDYSKYIKESTSFAKIVEDMESSPYYNTTEEYRILKNALENNPELGNYRMVAPSWNMNGTYNDGTYACVFTDGKGTNYVAYRGTGDGEWIDNGEGMTQIQTTQQKEAVGYFDQIAEELGWTQADDIIVCGHSKGGNKAQTVTLFSENSNLIDACYSLDGQGFSPEAVAYLKETLGEEEYLRRLEKMYSLRGENDYVSGLGIVVIPKENTWFIETGDDIADFAGHHKIQNMLDEEGHLRQTEPGPFSAFAEQLSEELMKLPPEERGECAMTIMQVMELKDELKVGLDGDHMMLEDLLGFLDRGVPLIMHVLLFTEEGWELLVNAGSEVVSTIYEKLGLTKTILLGLVIAVVFPLVKGVWEIAVILNRILEIYEDCKEFATTQIQNLAGLLKRWKKYIGETYEKIGEWIKNHLYGTKTGEFEIHLTAMEQYRQELSEQYRQIQMQVMELKAIRRNMDFGMAARISLSLKINRCIRQMEEVARMIRRMEECLDGAKERYRRTEYQIVGNYAAAGC